MAKNFYFENFGNSMEQQLIEDLVIESIRIYGIDTWFLPRTISAKDELYNEDALSVFDDAYMVEMYVKNVDGFEGEGDFLSKFGLQIRDSMTLTVAIRTFDTEVGAHSEQTRPNEGDLIYFPLNNKFFKVMHVEHESIFYQMGSLQTYDLRCELFEYSGERFETGQDFIDDYFDQKGFNNFVPVGDNVFTVRVQDGVFTLQEEGDQSIYAQPELDLYVGSTYVFDQSDASNAGSTLTFSTEDNVFTMHEVSNVQKVGTPGTAGAYTTWTPSTHGTYYYQSYDNRALGITKVDVLVSKIDNIEQYDSLADNETIEGIADNILDFSEQNPFGEDNF